MEAKKKETNTYDVEALDTTFQAIVRDYCDVIIGNASSSVGKILDLSSQFVDKSASKALKDFRDLYFFNDKIGNEAAAINASVDDIFDDLQEKIAAGEEVDYDESADRRAEVMSQNRMALSGLQKQLEQIITLDKNIKQRLLPVLASMQFEDMIRQRIEHVRDGWQLVIASLDESPAHMKEKLEEISLSLTSGSEKSEYYPRVLDREPPADIDDEQSLEDILF